MYVVGANLFVRVGSVVNHFAAGGWTSEQCEYGSHRILDMQKTPRLRAIAMDFQGTIGAGSFAKARQYHTISAALSGPGDIKKTRDGYRQAAFAVISETEKFIH